MSTILSEKIDAAAVKAVNSFLMAHVDTACKRNGKRVWIGEYVAEDGVHNVFISTEKKDVGKG